MRGFGRGRMAEGPSVSSAPLEGGEGRRDKRRHYSVLQEG